MNERAYIGGRGFEIDGATFQQHQRGCAACKQYAADKPATLSRLCLDGAVLWKRDNAQPIAREPAPYDPNHVSVAAAKKLMRYK